MSHIDRLTINQEYAKRFEHNEKRKEIEQLESKLDDDTDTTEDEEAILLTDQVDQQIMHVLQKIRQKDPEIYNQEKRFFDDEVHLKPVDKPSKPVTLKDIERRDILNEMNDKEPPTYFEEQKGLKEAVQVQVDDDDLLVLKNKAEPVNTQATGDFLMDYVLSNGWMDEASTVPHHNVPLVDDDPMEEERALQFEQDQQYRFESSKEIKSYGRQVQETARRQDNTRAEARKRREERKEKERQQKEQEVRRLKNLKKEEIMNKYREIAQAAGLTQEQVYQIPLDGDMDTWDETMAQIFDDSYYEVKESFDDVLREHPEALEDTIDEYYKLDHEDIVGGAPVRFNYKSVPANDYGMKPSTILLADEKEMNTIVGLKKLHPYKDKEYKVKKHKVKDLERSLKDKIKSIEDPEQRKIMRKWLK